MKELSGKTAVVTGAASGLGLAFSESFTALGMNVVMADVEAGPLAVEAERLGRAAEVLPLTVDVSSVDAIEQMHAATIERFGTAHVLCNNAGVGGGGNVADTSIEMWEWVLGVDLWGVIYGCKTFLPGMLAQGEGHIINTNGRHIVVKGDACFMPHPHFRVVLFCRYRGLLLVGSTYAFVSDKADYIGFRSVLGWPAVDKHFKEVRRLTIVFSLENKVHLLR